MTVKLKTPSNGSVSLTPQDTASDVVVTVPAGTSTMVTNATLPTQLNASGSAPIYACRAWVNFNGTLAAASMIRASGNISSITDNGTGDYTLNFTTAMPDANYSVVCSSASGSSSGTIYTTNAYTYNTGSVSIQNLTYQGASITRADFSQINVAIFR